MITRKDSPAEKRLRVQFAFESKVAILERWAREGVAEGAKVPQTHAALRRWTGPDGTLATWADPLIDRPGAGKYPDLTKRFKAAIENIDLRLRKAKKARVGALEAEVAVLRRENDALRIQNASLFGRLQTEQERVALLEDLLAEYGGEIPKRLNGTRPWRP